MEMDGPESLESLTAVNGVRGFNELRIFRLLRRFRSAMRDDGKKDVGKWQGQFITNEGGFDSILLKSNSHMESQTSSKRG